MNNQSTGAVFSCKGMTFITDCMNYSGTYIYDVYGNKAGKSDALMWYAVEFENNIYFSNQACNNYLYRYNMQTGVTEKVADVACRNLVAYSDFILFIDEKNGGILAFNCRTHEIFRISEIDVTCFVVVGNEICYSSKNGIGSVSLSEKHEKMLCPAITGQIAYFSDYLMFSDLKKSGMLSMLSLQNGQLFTVGNIVADCFAIYENYVFASNENDGKSISRIDVQSGQILRIYGDQAYELCVCGTLLYFQNEKKEWCRMTISGENFERIIF